MNELKINPPEGYEIDLDKSDLSQGIVNFKEIKVTYKSIADKLFSKKGYWIEESGNIKGFSDQELPKEYRVDPNNSAIKEQLESILALNMLCNVAKYLNDGWLPNKDENRYHLYQSEDGYLKVGIHGEEFHTSVVYFKDEETANKAVEILGEEMVRKTFFLNW